MRPANKEALVIHTMEFTKKQAMVRKSKAMAEKKGSLSGDKLLAIKNKTRFNPKQQG